MTALGKILVVVNLVVSLIVGAFLLMNFARGTNWQAGYERLKKYYEVSQAHVRTLEEEKKDLKSKADDDVKKSRAELDETKKKFKDSEDKNKELIAKHDAETLKARLAGANNETTTAELLRVKEESKKKDELLKSRDDKLVEQEKTIRAEREKSTRLDIENKSLIHRNQKVVEERDMFARENERLKAGGSVLSVGGASGNTYVRKPPPEDVEGIVTEVNPKDGLVSISIGSDAGISKGNTLYIYRLKPEPKYLGELQIIDANHHEAVGRPRMGQRAGMIQKGDRVASQIMGQR